MNGAWINLDYLGFWDGRDPDPLGFSRIECDWVRSCRKPDFLLPARRPLFFPSDLCGLCELL